MNRRGRRLPNWRYQEFPELPGHAYYGIVAAVIGSAVVGAGTSIYEGSQQQQASQSANTQNQANVSQANDQNWTSYLLSRGISTGGVVPAGTLPSSGTTAVNTKLPLWATVNVPNSMASGGGGSQLSGALGGTPTASGYKPTPPISNGGGEMSGGGQIESTPGFQMGGGGLQNQRPSPLN